MIKHSLSGIWQFRQARSQEWLPGQVPGGVHTDLLALGRIPDPFVADNERRVKWVAEAGWIYRCFFDLPAGLLDEQSVELVADGLDTLARVELNGHEIGRTANMFREYRWEVKDLLMPTGNVLQIAFDSPVRYVTARQAEHPLAWVDPVIPGGPYLRKSLYQFGWDWAPQLPPIGIWKDIRIEGYSTARIGEVALRQKHQEDVVEVQAVIDLVRYAASEVTVEMQITTPAGQMLRAETLSENGPVDLRIEILDPQVWWPNGYGDQPLYQVKITGQDAGRVIDQKGYRYGLRTIALRREPDQWGQSFTLVVNGVPIFARGAGWAPADTFPTQITADRLRGLLQSAVAANFNMLRVWGGGFFEDDRFYSLCDELGILVWQDCLFACSWYPLDDPDFIENVHQEVLQNVRRLRSHPSLALWCGNNEIESMAHLWINEDGERRRQVYEQFFYHTLPEWIAALDPQRPYWPSSPASSVALQDPGSESEGDLHFWDVWHGRMPFTVYREHQPRFMSEFGFQSLPPYPTIQTYAEPADQNMTSFIMEWHQRSLPGNGLMLAQMTDTFRMPKDFQALVYLSMVLQAEGIRYGVEHWRRSRARVSGVLYWGLNDCWPVASWSSLDYYGRWKALHYAARHFYAPLLLSIREEGTQVEIHLTNDRLKPVEGILDWQLLSLDGAVLNKGSEPASVAPQTSAPIFTKTFDLNDDQRRDVILIAALHQGDQVLAANRVIFCPNKHLKLKDPGLRVSVAPGENNSVAFAISSHSLARFAALEIPGKDVVFSDNYFDVLPGRTVTVTVPLPEGIDVEEVRRMVNVRSLYDSFA